MALSPGMKLGPYEIVAALGAGGMGEVYRAHDSRLGREVAIKVLPAELSADGDLRTRLEREARTVSSLNHPHICQLYDVGSQGGTDFLVMELLQGEPLDARLQKGPLPLKQTVEFGVQIADALEKAHRAGIIHRDLKPANIFLTPTGAKLLDFGLAKPTGAAVAGGVASTLTSSSVAHPTIDATSLSVPAQGLTQQGRIVGTFQYMAPEVVQGSKADARSDIFALGCVLYEMATGKRAFEGKSQLSVLTAILEHEPEPVSAVRPTSPAALDYVVQNCLEKDPAHRFQTAHDVKLQLAWVGKAPKSDSQLAVAPMPRRAAWRRWLAPVLGGLVVAVLAALAGRQMAQPKREVVTASLLPPEGYKFAPLNQDGPPELSPDGRRVAFVASQNGRLTLWVKELATGKARELPGTESGHQPFWAPDSRHLAYFASRKLWKTDTEGGVPEVVTDAAFGRGGSWGSGNLIVFAPSFSGPLKVVAPDGSGERVVTPAVKEDGNESARWPAFLPDGKHFVYLYSPVGALAPNNEIRFGSIAGDKPRTLATCPCTWPRYSAGYVLWTRDRTLLAQRMDATSGELSGEPVQVLNPLQTDVNTGAAIYSVSGGGSLLALEGTEQVGERHEWFSPEGKMLGALSELGFLGGFSLSPDDSQLVTTVAVGDTSALWQWDLKRGTRSQISPEGIVTSGFSVWAPDGEALYVSMREASPTRDSIVKRRLSSADPGTELVTLPLGGHLADVTADGRQMIYNATQADGSGELRLASTAGGASTTLLAGVDKESGAMLQPRSNRWLAYQGLSAGQPQIFVTSFPVPGPRYQVSPAGGTQPRWGKDGKHLYFLDAGGHLSVAEVTEDKAGIRFGTPRTLFPTSIRASVTTGGYDVARDGRLLVLNSQLETSRPLTLILNWDAGLKK